MTLEEDIAKLVELQAGLKAYKAKAPAIRKRILKQLSVGEHEVGGYKVKIVKDTWAQLDRERIEAVIGSERIGEYVRESERWAIKVKELEE